MKILLVSTEWPPGPGGIATHAHEVARGLALRGHDVIALARQDRASDFERQDFLDGQPYRFHRLSPERPRPRELLHWLRRVWSRVRRDRPDLVIASGLHAVWVTGLLRAVGVRPPVVAIGHGTEFGRGMGRLKRSFTRRAYRGTAGVVFVSEFTKQLAADAGVTPARSIVIPNGADPDHHQRWPDEVIDEFRHRRGVAGKRLLVTVGALSDRKAQDTVIRALPAIRERVPDVHYVAVGLPTREAQLRVLADELGVGDAVTFPGRVPRNQVVGWLNAADVFVLVSRTTADGNVEGYGIAAVEAALCGAPAVVSGNSGLAEAIVDKETGLVVPPDDPAATAAALLALLTDEPHRARMAQAARARAEREMTWQHRVARYDDWLSALIATPDRDAPDA